MNSAWERRWRVKSFRQARGILRRALELEPSHPEALVELGHLMRTLKRKDDAIGAYKAALEIDPDNVPVMLALSHQFEVAGGSRRP